MLDNLILHNFPSGYEPDILPDCSPFIMATCQRTLVLDYRHEQVNIFNTHVPSQVKYEIKTGKEAYSYLLEIICGLKSKMIGENEIVGQFKTAYQSYNISEGRSSRLLAIIEKLFKDAKEIRSRYLLGLSQKTYSCIARKHIVTKHKADSVLILGSGQLAEDLINQFKKKVEVFISARNMPKVEQLVSEHENITVIPWGDLDHLKDFPFIANSIGFNGVLLNDDFFLEWSKQHKNKLFVDLGSPSSIETQLDYGRGVMRLTDVFQEGAIHENHKKQQIEKAKLAMDGIVAKRHQIFINKKINHPTYKANHAYV